MLQNQRPFLVSIVAPMYTGTNVHHCLGITFNKAGPLERPSLAYSMSCIIHLAHAKQALNINVRYASPPPRPASDEMESVGRLRNKRHLLAETVYAKSPISTRLFYPHLGGHLITREGWWTHKAIFVCSEAAKPFGGCPRGLSPWCGHQNNPRRCRRQTTIKRALPKQNCSKDVLWLGCSFR